MIRQRGKTAGESPGPSMCQTIFDSVSCQQLAEGLLRELTRMGVTKPMRYTPGANAEG